MDNLDVKCLVLEEEPNSYCICVFVLSKKNNKLVWRFEHAVIGHIKEHFDYSELEKYQEDARYKYHYLPRLKKSNADNYFDFEEGDLHKQEW